MRYQVVHETRYSYDEPVTLGHNQLRLTPRSFSRQVCYAARIRIEPLPSRTRTWTDAFGNEVTYFTLEAPHHSLVISLAADVEVLRGQEFRMVDPEWETVRDQLRNPSSPLMLEAAQFLFDSPQIQGSAAAQEYARPSFPPRRPMYEALLDLTHRIHADFHYDPSATTVSTTTKELLQLKRGVCQDFAHLQITCLRSLGLAARYVSGYLATHPPAEGPRLVGADASHAWASVYFPDAGWIDFDPTNDKLAGMEHVTLAWGRDYHDVAPITGLILGGGSSTLQVAVDVSEFVTEADSP